MFADLLAERPPSPAEIAAKVTEVLRRTEEARIYHWHQRTGQFPPRRGPSAGQAGAPKKKRQH